MLTAYPEVVDALVGLFTDRVSGARVVDGPPLGDPSDAVTLYVGWGVEDIAAESLPADVDDLADSDTAEVLTVSCAVDVWTGDVEYKAVRDEATRVLRACVDALAVDPTLGGVVFDARVRRPVQFDQQPLAGGAGGAGGVRAAVAFTVTCRRYN